MQKFKEGIYYEVYVHAENGLFYIVYIQISCGLLYIQIPDIDME
jgi:hypothetical protein